MPRRVGKGFALNIPVEKGRLAPLRRKIHVFMLCPSPSRKEVIQSLSQAGFRTLFRTDEALLGEKHIPHTTPALFRICP